MAGFGEQEGLRGVTNHMQGLLAVLRSPGARQLLSPDATHRDCASEFTNQVCVGESLIARITANCLGWPAVFLQHLKNFLVRNQHSSET